MRIGLKFDDGFAAWFNGTLVASNLAAADLGWNSLASGNRSDALNDAWAVFSLPTNGVVEGTNLLAIQGFNTTVTSSDLLLLPELDLVYAAPATNAAYLFSPTPGLTNAAAVSTVPPTIELLSTASRPPGGAGSPPLTLTAQVTRTLWPVTNVTLFYRTMFNAEIPAPMSPATGGVCTASIPTTNLNAGEMIRWRIEARDSTNNIGTGPRFVDANDDDRYYGIVSVNPAETNSRLAALTNTWQLRNAVDYDFPTNQSLAAGARLRVVGFNPTNNVQLAAFRALYSLQTNIPIYGPWSGKLDNSGEQIELKRPDRPDTIGSVFVPDIMVEEIHYSHAAPWSTNADGLGFALRRRAAGDFADDPANWTAAWVFGTPPPDVDNDGLLDGWEQLYFGNLSQNAADDFDGDGMGNLQEYLSGTNPSDAASVLRIEAQDVTGTNFVMRFTAMSNHTYGIERRLDLSGGPWELWQGIGAVPSNRIVWLTNVIGTNTATFYRLATP